MSLYQFNRSLLFASKKSPKFDISPEVDEKVGEVVDVEDVEKVTWHADSCVDSDERWSGRDDADDEKSCPDLRRLRVRRLAVVRRTTKKETTTGKV